HTARVWGVAYSPDGRLLASAAGNWSVRGCSGGEVKLWDVLTGRCLETFVENDELIFAVAFSPDGKTLATAGWDRTIRLWDVRKGRLRASTGKQHEGPIRSLAFHPGGQMLVSASFDGTLRFWDVEECAQRGDPIRLAGTPPNCIVFSRNGKTFA